MATKYILDPSGKILQKDAPDKVSEKDAYEVSKDYLSKQKNYKEVNKNRFINDATKISEVEIYNALGDKVIHHLNDYSSEVLKFDLSNKTRGIYFVKIISGKKLINYKIVLQ